MHPVLLKFGNVTIYSYGFMIALGFFLGIVLAMREARRLGENSEKIMDLSFYILVAAIVGSRLFYVVTAWESFVDNPLEIIKLWKGGLVFYGGFIGAVTAAVIYMHRNRMPTWKTADILAPSLALGQTLGRLGCFLAGCCYGRQSDTSWAVTFTDPVCLAPVHTPLHPTQLYSAFTNLSIFVALMVFRRRNTITGRVFWTYVLLYGLTRSIIETLRGDFRGAEVLGLLSISQTLGLIGAVAAVFMLVRLSRSPDFSE
ncbi:MAG: prolipoprotein diacylglyceryl transferase [Desulfobacterales bacterium]|nr:prolipoprotein diacylglyceryl transferase [Desulfobacterales bacterium]